MKSKIRILSFLLAVLLLFAAVPVMTVSASDTANDPAYTKNKVVSVLFDNSGSMGGDKWNYARYALEALMTTLGQDDTLIITPMNVNGYANTSGACFTVNLAAEDRTKVISDIFFQNGSSDTNSTFLEGSPSGKTPAATIEVALQQLVKAGMKTTAEMGADEISENEYFLVVLTDGVFNPPGSPSQEITDPGELVPYFKEDLSKYASFQSIYIGFSSEALSLNNIPELDGAANFSAYKAEEASDIGGVMQDVANRITGRYPLTLTLDKNSNTVRIPLNGVGFTLRSVTVMATNTNARYAGASYGTEGLTASQNVSFLPLDNMGDMKGGFTAVLTRGNGSTFSDGEIVLELDEAPGEGATVSILLEPALVLSPVIECEVDGAWRSVDAAYINSNLKKGDNVRLSYQIIEQDTGKVLKEDSPFFDGVVARVTYNTKSYGCGENIPLVEGKHEIGLSVSVMNGAYTLYASFPCVVLENPSFFRIESGKTTVSSGIYTTPFTVYDNNRAITSLAELETYSPAVTATAEDGSLLPVEVKKQSDGTFTASIALADKGYGTYTLHASVRSPDGNPRSLDTSIGHFPAGLTATVTGKSDISTTLHGIKQNTEGYTFALTAPSDTGEDVLIPFELSQVTYQVTVGNTDITSSAMVNGNVLTLVPTAQVLGALAETTGTLAIKLSVSFDKGSTTEIATAQTTLTLTDTVFAVVPLDKEPDGVDRFDLNNNQSSLYFRVLRDGVSLPAEELQAALDDGTFTVDPASYGFALSPLSSEQTVEIVDGAPAVRVRICSDQGGFLPFILTSMFVFGSDKTIKVAYGAVAAEDTIPLLSPSIFQYIIRILVYLYIVQLIILAVTFRKVKRIPQGVFVRVPIVDYEKEETELKGKVIIIKTVGLREYLILKRLIPFIGLCFWKKDIPTTEGTLKYHQNAGVCIAAGIKCTEGELKPNGTILSSTLKNKGWSALKPGVSFSFNKVALTGVTVKTTQKASKANIDQPLTGSRGLVLKNKFYLFVNARSAGKKQ